MLCSNVQQEIRARGDILNYHKIVNGQDTYPFRVDRNGILYATGANISGRINATSGNFSDRVTIGGTSVTGQKLRELYSFATGGNGISITQIAARQGSIAGWTITDGSLKTNDGETYLSSNGICYGKKGIGTVVISDYLNSLENRSYCGVMMLNYYEPNFSQIFLYTRNGRLYYKDIMNNKVYLCGQ